MTEMVGYNGPIYMTVPTKAIAPILLEDMRKVAVDRKWEQNFFTPAMIKDCMRKVVSVNLHQVVQVDNWTVSSRSRPTMQVNYYKLPTKRSGRLDRNMFDFKHIKAYDRSMWTTLQAWPHGGMLHAGLSLTIFRRWCREERNLKIMPGYCVAGTICYQILNGQRSLRRGRLRR